MSPFAIDKRDIQFCIFEYLKAEELCKLPIFSEFNKELLDMVIDESIKLAVDVVAPLNLILDRDGAKFEDGKVTMPAECHKAYKRFCEGGWVSPTANPEHGGQGLPFLFGASITEIQASASISFLMTPGLTRAASHVVEVHGTDELKKLYVDKMNTGTWGGTMCLTESSAGSAVGDLKSKAKKEGDQYFIEGEKIFISSGEHDLTENIVHLVLARLEGAPKGIKGISLFLVPKIKVNPDGSLGEANNVICGNIEHKMGIKGSPTCTMVFGADGPCQGYLIGEENEGIKYMFQMMNEARIGVALQGLAAASASYQEAIQYAAERVQGVDITQMKDVDAPRVAIIKHPDVRRNLMLMKSMVEGMRAMTYFTAKCSDLAEHAEDEGERKKYRNMLELLTPICKAYCSDQGFKVTELGMQVFGGYGYTQEYPMELYCRDVKITSIYEGTNGIQALDLLGRKLTTKGGAVFMTFLMHVNDFINEHKEHPTLGEYVAKLEKARDVLSQVVMHVQKCGMEGDVYYPVLQATPFLELFGTLVVDFFLQDQALVAEEKLAEIFKNANASSDEDKKKTIAENPDAKFYDGKLHSMKFFTDIQLPRINSIAESIMGGNRSALDIQF
jgi:alkylation response protein AidB-like acyl-CoA dehydrogenase